MRAAVPISPLERITRKIRSSPSLRPRVKVCRRDRAARHQTGKVGSPLYCRRSGGAKRRVGVAAQRPPNRGYPSPECAALSPRTFASAPYAAAPCRTSTFDQLVWPAVMRPPQLLRPSPLSYGWPVRVPGRPYALPKLHGRKHGDEALLCRVRSAAAVPLPRLRFRERAQREVLRWLWQAARGDCRSSPSGRARAPAHR